jgi:hypothetical protein
MRRQGLAATIAGVAILGAPPTAAGAHEEEAGGWAFGPRLQAPSLAAGGEKEEQEQEGRLLGERDRGIQVADNERLYDSHNTDGQAGSGGRAIAYQAGGRVIRDAVAGAAPDALLWRTGYGSWEPTLGTTKDGTVFFSARNTNLDPGVARSRDGGRTWEDVTPATHTISLDPYIWVDRPTGRVYASDIEASVTCPPISWSDDRGETWTTSTPCGVFDHQTVFGGPPPELGRKPSGYPHVVYYCAISGGALAGTSTFTGCLRSRDGGQTFEPTAEPPFGPRLDPRGSAAWCDGPSGHGVVDDSGAVYLARGWCGEPYLAISRDEGDSWRRIHLPGPELKDYGDGTWEHEANVAIDRDGAIYVDWSAGDGHAYLAVSRNRGRNWRVHDVTPPGVQRTSLPNIDVGDPGRVALVFEGSRQDAGAPSDQQRWDSYMVISADVHAGDPVFYAATVNDPADPMWIGSDCGGRCGNIGDFLDVVVGLDGTAWAALVDSCPGECTEFEVQNARGEGVVGQLVGGPPLVGTIADQRPGVSMPRAPRRCTPRRRLTVRLRQPRRGRIRAVRAYVNGRRARVRLVGSRHPRAVVDLRRARGRTARVRLLVRTTTGRLVRRDRRYRLCPAG